MLAARARWRGIPTEILTITADSTPPAGCDVYLLGGGEDTAQLFAADWLRGHRDLHHALDSSARVLAVCAGLQILGHTMRDRAGRDHPGLGVLDVTTAPGRRRAVGEIITDCAIPGVGQLTGFENHLGITTLGPGAAPLGTVVDRHRQRHPRPHRPPRRGRPHRPCHRHLPARPGPGPQPGPGRPPPDRHHRHRIWHPWNSPTRLHCAAPTSAPAWPTASSTTVTASPRSPTVHDRHSLDEGRPMPHGRGRTVLRRELAKSPWEVAVRIVRQVRFGITISARGAYGGAAKSIFVTRSQPMSPERTSCLCA